MNASNKKQDICGSFFLKRFLKICFWAQNWIHYCSNIFVYIYFRFVFHLVKSPKCTEMKPEQNLGVLMDSTCSLFSFFRHATRDSFFTFFFKRFPLSDQQQLKFDIQLVAAARWEEPADSDQNNILWHLKKKSYSTFFLGFSSSFFCVTGFGAVFV